MVESAGRFSTTGSARQLLVPHGVVFFLTTLKGISGIKAPSQHCAGALALATVPGGVASLGWHHCGWGSPLSQPFGPGASHLPQPLYLCVYFSLFLDTQRRLCKAEGRCLPGVSPREGRGGRICTASLRWPKYVCGGGEEMLKGRG